MIISSFLCIQSQKFYHTNVERNLGHQTVGITCPPTLQILYNLIAAQNLQFSRRVPSDRREVGCNPVLYQDLAEIHGALCVAQVISKLDRIQFLVLFSPRLISHPVTGHVIYQTTPYHQYPQSTYLLFLRLTAASRAVQQI